MSAAKYLSNSSGQIQEIQTVTTSTAYAIPSLDSTGRLNIAQMPIGVAADTETIVASEALDAGNLVNIYNNGGTPNVRKADCSNGRRAHGFVLAGVLQSGNATVYKDSTITGLTIAAADVGLPHYLSTSGAVSKTAPSTSGYISQEIGYSVSATSIAFEPAMPITLA